MMPFNDRDPVPAGWEWTHQPTVSVVGPPAEVQTWPVIEHMAGPEAAAIEVQAVQLGRRWQAPNARLLAARQRLWCPGDTYGAPVAVQMQLDVLLMKGPEGHYLQWELLPDSNPTDQKEG